MTELSDKKIWLYGLLIDCPQGQPLSDCPLEQYRTGSNKDRLNVLENFTEEQVEEIIKHHNQCLLRRVQPEIINKSEIDKKNSCDYILAPDIIKRKAPSELASKAFTFFFKN